MFNLIKNLFKKEEKNTKESLNNKIKEYIKGKELAFQLKNREPSKEELSLIIKNLKENNIQWLLGFNCTSSEIKFNQEKYTVEYMN